MGTLRKIINRVLSEQFQIEEGLRVSYDALLASEKINRMFSGRTTETRAVPHQDNQDRLIDLNITNINEPNAKLLI